VEDRGPILGNTASVRRRCRAGRASAAGWRLGKRSGCGSLEDENRMVEATGGDLSLDKEALKAIVRKRLELAFSAKLWDRSFPKISRKCSRSEPWRGELWKPSHRLNARLVLVTQDWHALQKRCMGTTTSTHDKQESIAVVGTLLRFSALQKKWL
jgi:hypothetical protein